MSGGADAGCMIQDGGCVLRQASGFAKATP
jgi:hypothetical protein